MNWIIPVTFFYYYSFFHTSFYAQYETWLSPLSEKYVQYSRRSNFYITALKMYHRCWFCIFYQVIWLCLSTILIFIFLADLNKHADKTNILEKNLKNVLCIFKLWIWFRIINNSRLFYYSTNLVSIFHSLRVHTGIFQVAKLKTAIFLDLWRSFVWEDLLESRLGEIWAKCKQIRTYILCLYANLANKGW